MKIITIKTHALIKIICLCDNYQCRHDMLLVLH